MAFLETSPYLLAMTIVVSILHSIFEFLAFKNGTGWVGSLCVYVCVCTVMCACMLVCVCVCVCMHVCMRVGFFFFFCVCVCVCVCVSECVCVCVYYG